MGIRVRVLHRFVLTRDCISGADLPRLSLPAAASRKGASLVATRQAVGLLGTAGGLPGEVGM